MIKLYLIVLLLIPTISFASSVQVDVTDSKIKQFSFKEVCKEMGPRHVVMIDIVSLQEISCMASKVKIIDFCLKKFPVSPDLLRGYVVAKSKTAVCQFGSAVRLKVKCKNNRKKFCKNDLEGCKLLREIYAKKHQLVNYSLAENGPGDFEINCFYSDKKSKIDLIDHQLK